MSERTKHRYNILVTLLAIISLIAVLGAISGYITARQYKKTLNHSYSRSLADLTDCIRDIDNALIKGMLVSSPSQMVKLSNEIGRYSNSAISCIGQLPLSDTQLDNTEKFLAQVGAYSNHLAVQAANGNSITDKNYQEIISLADYCDKLLNGLEKTQKAFYKGNLSMERLKKSENKNKNATTLSNEFSSSEKEMTDYPALVYDGPFSSHIDTIEYSALKDAKTISEGDAIKIAEDFIKNDNYIIRSAGEKEGKLPSYIFEAYPKSSKNKTRITIEITKKGGKVSWFLNSRNPESSKISVTDAIEKASAFLKEHGYENMTNSYYDARENVATINFAYMEKDVIMYPDLIKVKIALDNGECLGIEANGYLFNNKTREIPQNIIPRQQAEALINPNLNVQSVSLCYIPTDSKGEVLCYEFKGNVNDKNFLVYFNAVTGVQEDILILLESENGILTM
ncbi:MAG: germination protein YpeB [Clostridia bacterium]|nr:germination protein YpeB [Clostridia bacterium]